MTVLWLRQHSARIDELPLARFEDERLEVWEGEAIPMPPAGKDHNEIAVRFLLLFHEFCAARKHLRRTGDNDGFVVGRDPDSLLCPDAALFRRRPDPKGSPWHDFAPDLAVEILSPRDNRAALLAKRDLYFKGGGEQVWIADPDEKTLEVHFADGRAMVASEGKFQGEGVAEGLTVDLGRIFEDTQCE